MSDPLLQLDQVSLSDPLGFNNLLQDISLSIYPGDRISIVGPSGAGKSTLLRLLNRLSDPTTGEIIFNQQPITQYPVIDLRRKIVLVLQEPKLLDMTVLDALCYPLTLQQRPKAEIHQRLDYWCKQLKIPSDWLDRNELQLSVGQRQIVAIARALMMEPQLLLLDEPTAALDAGRAETLLEVLAPLQQTLVMVTHQLDFAEKFSDRTFYLHKGQLCQDVSSQDLDWTALRQKIVDANTDTSDSW